MLAVVAVVAVVVFPFDLKPGGGYERSSQTSLAEISFTKS